MATITSKVLKDTNGDAYVPITHIDAVLDSDGQKLSSILARGGSGEDAPESLGVLYAMKKAEEMIRISQYIRASLPVPSDNQVAGDTLVGLPYSSTRKTNTFVPNCVNYDTYLSALSSANSYAYTVNPNLGANGALYYGVVCIMFVQYCLGIDVPRHTNLSLFGVPGMEQVEVQDAQSMRLGYVINCAKNDIHHCMLCTGITRENGVITKLRMSESYQPVCREVEYTATQFNSLLTNYTIIRYNKIDQNTYHPFIQLPTESMVNRNVQTRRGERSNWHTSEDVVLDVIDAASYTSYKLFKDGELADTDELPANNVINLGHLPYGKYKLYLTDSTNNSPAVEWIVVDCSVSAESQSGGIVNVTFSSKNAAAVGVAWCNDSYMMRVVKEIPEANRISGTMATSLDNSTQWANANVSGYNGNTEKANVTYSDGDAIYVRVLFMTEYGIYTSPWPTSPVLYDE